MTLTAGGALERVINLPALCARIDDDAELLQELFKIFREELPRLHGQLKEAVAASDSEQVETAAHTLKGMLGNLSAEPAAAAIVQMGLRARAGSEEGLQEALLDFEKRIVELGAAVDAYLDEVRV